MDQILEKLFGSIPKVRLLRLFMHNLDETFEISAIAKRTQVQTHVARKELGKFVGAGIVTQKNARIPFPGKRNVRYKETKVFRVNSDFPLLFELRDLVIKS